MIEHGIKLNVGIPKAMLALPGVAELREVGIIQRVTFDTKEKGAQRVTVEYVLKHNTAYQGDEKSKMEKAINQAVYDFQMLTALRVKDIRIDRSLNENGIVDVTTEVEL